MTSATCTVGGAAGADETVLALHPVAARPEMTQPRKNSTLTQLAPGSPCPPSSARAANKTVARPDLSCCLHMAFPFPFLGSGEAFPPGARLTGGNPRL